MSGSNSICVATVLLNTGILPVTEPETDIVLEAPGGIVQVKAYCENGKAKRIKITNVASFVDRRDATIEIEGMGTFRVDTAYGGDSFVIVDAADFGFTIQPDEALDLVNAGMKIVEAANEQLGFTHPENPDWDHISFCQFAGPLVRNGNELSGRNAVAIRPGKIDRCPTGTGCSARMALLHARGEMQVEDVYRAHSIIGSEFVCGIEEIASVKDTPAIRPSVMGSGWITGTYQLVLDPDDPFPQGYRLSDTWPGIG
ncbi:MAG: hypothetical protein HKN43_12925, partial [Rhodothermales bacterium]|nr:hypothetical protein [Rhodothermales bacterium]